MVLLVPLIRSLSKYPLVVHVRRHAKKGPKQGRLIAAREEEEASDPFAQEEAALYDIRIKRTDVTITESAAQNSVKVGTAKSIMYKEDEHYADPHHHQQQHMPARFRVDSQEYYSPLAEINLALSGIEAETHKGRLSNDPSFRPTPAVSTTPSVRGRSSSEELLRTSSLSGYTTSSNGTASTNSSGYSTDYRSQSFSGAPTVASTAAAAPAPSLMQSWFGWWDTPAPPQPPLEDAPLPPAAPHHALPAVIAQHTLPPLHNATQVEADHKEDRTETTAGGEESNPASAVSASAANDSTASTPSKPATVGVSPAAKIAERLQQIRAQKLQQLQPYK